MRVGDFGNPNSYNDNANQVKRQLENDMETVLYRD